MHHAQGFPFRICSVVQESISKASSAALPPGHPEHVAWGFQEFGLTALPVCHYKAWDHTAFCLNTSAQHSCEEGTLEFSGKQGRAVALVSFHPSLSLRRCSWSRPEKPLHNNETNGARTTLHSSLAEKRLRL